jgi:hypothetical protein
MFEMNLRPTEVVAAKVDFDGAYYVAIVPRTNYGRTIRTDLVAHNLVLKFIERHGLSMEQTNEPCLFSGDSVAESSVNKDLAELRSVGVSIVYVYDVSNLTAPLDFKLKYAMEREFPTIEQDGYSVSIGVPFPKEEDEQDPEACYQAEINENHKVIWIEYPTHLKGKHKKLIEIILNEETIYESPEITAKRKKEEKQKQRTLIAKEKRTKG